MEVKVRNNQGQMIPNQEITLVENRTFERKEFKTDATGKVTVLLDSGQDWTLNIGEMRNYKTFRVPENGNRKGSMSVTYDLEHWNRISKPPVDRSKLQIRDIPQTIASTQKPTAKESVVELELKDKAGKSAKGIEVKMTCYETLRSYVTKTDKYGEARFLVPIKQNYQIDIDGDENASYCDLPEYPSSQSMSMLFEKIDFEESIDADGFLVQKFNEDPKGTSNRVFVTLKVMGGPNEGVNEEVTLDMAYSNNKYKATTNSEGEAAFLLPLKRQYIVSFPFQRDADVLNLKEFRGVGECYRSFMYEPDPRLQFPMEYLPSKENIPDLNINNYVTEEFQKTGDNELVNVHARWGNKKINSGSQEAILELGFSANKPGAKSKKTSKPVNISFVLDKSGSMSGEKFDVLKLEMAKFIDKMGSKDMCSLVFFESDAVAASPQQRMTNKSALKDILAVVQTGGGTNIYEGLKLGYEEVAKQFKPEYTNRVVLLTDGYGSRPIEDLLALSKTYFEKGISVSTIGVGDRYNESLLTILSEYSGGMRHHAIDGASINKALDKEFESLFYPLAEDLKVNIKYNNKIVFSQLYGVSLASKTDGNVTINLNKVYSSMNTLAMVKFKLENANKSIEQDKIIITVTYTDLVSDKKVTIVKEKALEWTEETDLELLVKRESQQLYGIAVINQSLKAVADLCVAENYADARINLGNTQKYISKLTEDQYGPDLKAAVEELKLFIAALDYVLDK